MNTAIPGRKGGRKAAIAMGRGGTGVDPILDDRAGTRRLAKFFIS